MNSRAGYKKNHFVPKAYLKRFTDPSKWDDPMVYINSLNLKDYRIRQSGTNDQCQKKNLYKLPDDFKMEEKKAIEKAFMGHIDKIYSEAMLNSFDKGKDPSIGDINSLVWFVIYQSFRTPKFKNHHIEKVKKLGLKMGKNDSDLEEYTYWLGYLLVKAGLDIFKYSLIEILFTRQFNWFITSDNPANYWLQTWDKSEYIGTVLGHNEKSNLKLICPINPQVAIILHVNYLKNTSTCNSAETMNYFRRTIERIELDYINSLIIQAAEKQIFSIDMKQLEIIKRQICA